MITFNIVVCCDKIFVNVAAYFLVRCVCVFVWCGVCVCVCVVCV